MGFRLRIFFCLFFAFLGTGAASAQSPSYVRYTADHGLPSNTVYDVIQDHQGFMWFATDAGIARFNGIQFETFTMQDGLTDNEVLQLYEDPYNRIWLSTFNGELCYYRDGNFFNRHNDSMLSSYDDLAYIGSPIADSLGNTWFTIRNSGLLKIEENKISVVQTPESLYNVSIKNIFKIEDQIPFVQDWKGGVYRLQGGQLFLSEALPFRLMKARVHGLDMYYKNSHLFARQPDGAMGQVFTLREDIHSSIIKNLVEEKDGRYWLLTEGSVWLCDTAGSENPKRFLPGKKVSMACVDNSDNIWFTTLNNGIYFLPDNGSTIFTISEGLSSNVVTKVTDDGAGGLIIGLESSSVQFKKDQEFVTKSFANEMRMYNKTTDILVDRYVWYGKAKLLANSSDYRYISGSGSTKDIEKFQGKIWVASHKGLTKFDPEPPFHRSEEWVGRLVSLCNQGDSILWLGTSNGLRYWYRDSIYQYQLKPDSQTTMPLSLRINRVLVLTNGNLVLGTHNHGLYILNPDGEIAQFSTQDDLSNNSITDLHEYESRLWVATRNGLNELSFDGQFDLNGGITRLRSYFIKDGLPSNLVYSIYPTDSCIWLGTEKGLVKYRPRDMSARIAMPIYIRNFFVNGTSRDQTQSMMLKRGENTIDIDFVTLAYNSYGPISYEYKLEGIDEASNITTNDNVRYVSLGPGDYAFSVVAFDASGERSSVPATIEFSIQPAIWETLGFRILLGILVMLILVSSMYLILRWIRKREQRKRDLDKKIAELELNALRSQMNPHFVFNSLNAIQHFMLQNNERSVNAYLSKFSSLMRHFLESSKVQSINLKEEIDMLSVYIDLERLRFEEKFDFRVIIMEDLNPSDYEIPPMLIQPFLENAINHGLLQKDEKGTLELVFSVEDRSLTCRIIDDGIGRENASMAKKDAGGSYPSRGMHMIMERVALLNESRGFDIRVIVRDRDPGNLKYPGTLVELKFPLQSLTTI